MGHRQFNSKTIQIYWSKQGPILWFPIKLPELITMLGAFSAGTLSNTMGERHILMKWGPKEVATWLLHLLLFAVFDWWSLCRFICWRHYFYRLYLMASIMSSKSIMWSVGLRQFINWLSRRKWVEPCRMSCHNLR